jgi:hypothetical protein
MKKVLSTIVAILIAAPTFAQYSSGGFSLDEENLYYGVRLGMTSATLTGDVVDLGSRFGLTLAGIVGLRASNTAPVFLESGLYYTERGAKKDKVTLSYNNLEIPFVVKYGLKVSDDIALLPFLGPYFSYAISGKYKSTLKGAEFEWGAFDEKQWAGLKRANMGIKLGCGAEYNNLYLELGYQFGITNICKDDDFTSRSNALFVNFGVNF